ncbi:MAG: hypothetical protein L0H26_08565, partial [Microlunatus sp.]|nr:hypothetical protein [Microlunatus sp.]
IVVDDNSSDPTGDYAAAWGAIVVTRQRHRGGAGAIESGVNALGVLEQRDKRPDCGTVLILDPDLGGSAAGAQALIGPVVTGRADLTIAVQPGMPVPSAEVGDTAGTHPTARAGTDDPARGGDDSGSGGDATGAGGPDLAERTAAWGIRELTGWTPRAPLGTNRCLTRRAYELASPLAAGAGADVGMSVDLLRAGLRVSEVEVAFDSVRPTQDLSAQVQRARAVTEVSRALTTRGLLGSGLEEFRRSGVRGLLDKFRP